MAPSKSIYWKYFSRSSDGKTATCKLCVKTVRTSGNTSNLRSHLSSSHGNVTDKENKRDLERSLANEPGSSSNILKDANSSEQPTKKLCTLPTSEAGCLTKNPAGSGCEDDPAPPLPSTSKHAPVRNVQKTVKEVFQDNLAFKDGGTRHSKLTSAISFMIVKDCQPFSIVENEGFMKVLHTAVPSYKVPSRFTMKRIIKDRFEILAQIFKEKLSSVASYTLTTDVWTDTMQTRSFLGITIHFGQDVRLYSATLGVFELDERHTSEYIAAKLIETCDDWKINHDKVIAVVTDSAANMIKAINIAFGSKKHIPCFAHTLNLIADRSIKSDKDLVALLSKVKRIVTWFKHSVAASDDLRKATPEEKKLIQEVPTRWNSTYFMVQRFLELRPFINEIINRHVSAPEMISAKEIESLSEVCDTLMPLEAATKEICGEKYLTCSLIIPMVYCLENKIEKLNPKQELGTKLKNSLLAEMKRRFEHLEHVQLLALSTLLDPRFKKIHFKDVGAAGKTVNVLKNIVTTSMTHTQTIESESSDSDQSAAGIGNFSLWSDHNKLVEKTWHKSREDANSMPSELTLYLRAPVARLGDKPLEIWKEMAPTYPNLSKIASQYLTIIGTSVPSERLFSKAGQILTQQRNKLKGSMLSQLLFLHSLDGSLWDL